MESQPGGSAATSRGDPPTADGGSRPKNARRGGNRSRGRSRTANTSVRPEDPSTDPSANGAESSNTSSSRGGHAAGDRNANRRKNRRGGSGGGGDRGHRSFTAASGPTPARGRGGLRGAGGYAFGGHLTGSEPVGAELGLHGGAPVFTPGAPVQTRGPAMEPSQKERNLPTRQRKVSLMRSTAPDIATRTHEDIASGLYECSICVNEVRANSKVWACHTCWTVFHLGCIKKWSKNEGSTMAPSGPVDADDPTPRQWRCPGCNLPKDILPSVYTCWCEKEIDPRAISGVPPHSCAQTCSRPRALPKQCPHPCELTCHAGPCPPCTHMGPVQSCFCGKEASSRRCIETNYVDGWSCGQPCGDIMPCGEHACPRPCHEGLCGACEVTVDAKCYCGKVEKKLQCNDQEEPKSSQSAPQDGDSGAAEQWTGVFDCGQVCGRAFDCGKHICENTCHAKIAATTHCPYSPDVVTRCPCGKTPLVQISESKRQSCDGRIPNCDKQCSKHLPCGHTCKQTCHLGLCPPCSQDVHVTCRCGRTTEQKKCHQTTNEVPLCSRSCKALLNCARHECGEQCCPGEKKAAERLAQKKKPRSLDAIPQRFMDQFEPEHICTRLCGRPLKCGSHSCPELCHRGPCNSCREAVFEEVSCHCGKTVLHPPLPCGTKAPPCRFPCERPKDCGHPRVEHNCHQDEEPCPSCPYLMEKPCLCKRKTLKNQPCFRTEVMCGEICGKRLRCGAHFCRKPCHRPGECEDATTRCQQQCGDPKKACGHPCEDRCHSPSACKEDKPCPSKLLITCECQNLKTETRCLASRTSEGNKNKTLKCDDECARLKRNHELAVALNVDPDHQDTHVPYSNIAIQMYQEDTTWAQSQERELRLFAADDSQKRLRCKPMPSHRRAFVHALAEDFGFDSESVDPEPHRHVFIFKTPRFVKAPMKTLAESVRIRAGPVGLATPSKSESQQDKLTTDNQPFNGFVLSAPRFALTLEELRSESTAAMGQARTLAFDIEFLPSEEVIFKARPSNPNTTIAPQALEASLKGLKPAFSAELVGKKLAGSVAMCALDKSLNILRRENTEMSTSSGWNRVAARAAMPKAPMRPLGPAAIGQRSSFTVLSKKKEPEKKKAAPQEVVADDWEEEVRKEEEEEEVRRASYEGSDGAREGASDVEHAPAHLQADASTEDLTADHANAAEAANTDTQAA